MPREIRTVTILLTTALALGAGPAHTDEAIAVADFTLKTLSGESVSLHESLRGGPVLVAFWATWCKPCLQELPEISERSEAWAERGLTTYAISIDKPRSQGRVRSYVRSQGFDFGVLLDPNQEAFRKLQGQTVPYLVLLDASGEARYTKVGYRPGDEEVLAGEVEKLLAPEGEADDTPVTAPDGDDAQSETDAAQETVP